MLARCNSAAKTIKTYQHTSNVASCFSVARLARMQSKRSLMRASACFSSSPRMKGIQSTLCSVHPFISAAADPVIAVTATLM